MTQPVDDGSYYPNYLRRMGVLYLGILVLILAALFGAFYFAEIRKIAYVKSHPPVAAAIVAKKEMRGKGRYTEVTIDYWRETSRGSVHCKASVNLPGWSSEYDIGRPIEVFPREDTCSDPYLAFSADYPKALLAGTLLLALVGTVMIVLGSFSMRRSRTSPVGP